MVGAIRGNSALQIAIGKLFVGRFAGVAVGCLVDAARANIARRACPGIATGAIATSVGVAGHCGSSAGTVCSVGALEEAEGKVLTSRLTLPTVLHWVVEIRANAAGWAGPLLSTDAGTTSEPITVD